MEFGPSCPKLIQLEGGNNSGSKIKKEEENTTLASKGQPEQCKRKKDLSNIKCVRCGEMGNYAT